MKKILSMMAIAAMVCGAFTACDNEDENENNPVTPEPQAIEATATATSVTVTVNPELLKGGEIDTDEGIATLPDGAPNGYIVAIATEEEVIYMATPDTDEEDEEQAAVDEEQVAPTEEDIKQALESVLGTAEDIEVLTETKSITFEKTTSYFYGYFGGKDISANTVYYVAAAPLDENGEPWSEVIIYKTITTPAE